MNAEAWVRILFTYGPFAILVLLLFVAEPKIRRAGKDAPPEEKRTYLAVYSLNWLAVFGLVVFSVYAWSDKNLGQEPTIRGRLERLTGQETLATSSAQLFFRKLYVSDLRYDYEWRIVASEKLVGQKINITVDPSTCNGGEGNVTDYDLPIEADFYERPVQIYYDAGQRKMFVVKLDGTPKELPTSASPLAAAPASAASTAAPPWSFFETVAHAQQQMQQGPPQPADFARALESPDPIVRRNARAELARQGAAALPWIEDALAQPGSSYRLKLGTVVALNNMQGLRAGSLKPTTVDAIIKAANDPDEALRNEARSLVKNFRLAPVTVYEHYHFNGRSQDFLLETYLANKRQFGELPDNSASSLRVAKGYSALLCENEGTSDGKGRGLCKRYGEGSHQLTGGVADRVSFIQVSKP